jgi:D-alanyl-D-alanine carboxypeptidase
MVITAAIPFSKEKTGKRFNGHQLAHPAWLIFVLIAVTLICAFPVEAKKKTKRSRYSPPQASMVIDAYSGKILHAENVDSLRYPASVTKVMTLYLLFEQIDEGQFTLESKLKVSAKAASRPPSKLGLEAGSTISVRDAMYALVTKSANDVAAVIAENIAGSEDAFARMMTQKARSIGMSRTTFRNASGLPDQGQVTSARDLTTLGRRIMTDFPEESKIFRTRYFQYGDRKFKNHNRLLFSYAGMEGMKTGFTRASGFNLLASCRRSDKHLIAVVLGGRSSGHRNGRMQSLLNQSWRKAVALNDLKQRGFARPVAIAGILQADMMPERNPAFHPTVSERTLRIAIVNARKAKAAAQDEPNRPQLALAASVAAPQMQTGGLREAAETLQQEEGDQGEESPAEERAPLLGPYHIQVGSFLDTQSAQDRLISVSKKAASLLDGHKKLTVQGDVRGTSYYRARFGRFSRKDASSTCRKLKRLSVDCLVVRIE